MSFKYRLLEECIDLIIDNRGKTPKKMGGDWVDEGIKTISAKNVHDRKLDNIDSIRCITQEVYNKWMKEDIKKGDCLLASEGATLGENLYWNSEEKVAIGQRLYCIRTNESILDSKYFSAYMNTNEYQKEIEGKATGTSVLGIKQTELLKTRVLIKDINEQRFIGSLYFDLNEKIEVNNQINKKLEETAQAIFKRWFVDFEFPDENGNPYKSSGGKMVESELGIIPKGWEFKKLSELAEMKNGVNYGRNQEGEVVNVINVRDFDGSLLVNNDKLDSIYIPRKQINDYKLQKSDTIIVRSAKPGETLLVNDDKLKVYSGFTIRIRAQKNINKIYLFYCVRNSIRKLENSSNGTIFKNLNQQLLGSLDIVEVPIKILENYNKLVKTLIDKIYFTTQEVNKLIQVRDTLLPKLMSGEIRVPLEK